MFEARCLVSYCASLLEEFYMISWTVTFFVIALIAGAIGFSGIAGAAVNIAWIVALAGLVLSIVYGVRSRHPPL